MGLNFNEIQYFGKCFGALTERRIRDVVLKESIAIVTKISICYYDGRGCGCDESWQFDGLWFNKKTASYAKFSYSSNTHEYENIKDFTNGFERLYAPFKISGDTFIDINDEDNLNIEGRCLGLTRLVKLYPELGLFDSHYVGNCNDELWFIGHYIARRIEMAEGNVKEINDDFAMSLVNSGDATGNYRPLGKFFVYSETPRPIYTAFDNESGFCWTEDFDTFGECMAYLVGEDRHDG